MSIRQSYQLQANWRSTTRMFVKVAARLLKLCHVFGILPISFDSKTLCFKPNWTLVIISLIEALAIQIYHFYVLYQRIFSNCYFIPFSSFTRALFLLDIVFWNINHGYIVLNFLWNLKRQARILTYILYLESEYLRFASKSIDSVLSKRLLAYFLFEFIWRPLAYFYTSDLFAKEWFWRYIGTGLILSTHICAFIYQSILAIRLEFNLKVLNAKIEDATFEIEHIRDFLDFYGRNMKLFKMLNKAFGFMNVCLFVCSLNLMAIYWFYVLYSNAQSLVVFLRYVAMVLTWQCNLFIVLEMYHQWSVTSDEVRI